MKKELVLGLATLILFVLNLFSWNFLLFLKENEFRVIFFDVGQGDAILIRTPQNHHILIDGGPGEKILEKLEDEIPFLYKHIDLVILTHPHYDHVSGLFGVIEYYDVEEIICTGVTGEERVSRKWKKLLKKEGYKKAMAGKRISGNNFYLDILYPEEELKGKKVSDLNEASVVSRFVFDDSYSFLFTGDAYKKQEGEILDSCNQECDLDTDILKVGHHGSNTSTSEKFLLETSPSEAVIMVGKDNPYGHPHRDVIRRLKSFGVEVRRTDKEGDIIFKKEM